MKTREPGNSPVFLSIVPDRWPGWIVWEMDLLRFWFVTQLLRTTIGAARLGVLLFQFISRRERNNMRTLYDDEEKQEEIEQEEEEVALLWATSPFVASHNIPKSQFRK